MALEGWNRPTSPFHAGEIELHTRLGRAERMEAMGKRIMRPYMPEQHRAFFNQLPFIVAGSVDQQGWPWASMLFGEPGFISTLDDRSLTLSGGVVPGDIIAENLAADSPISLVGVELPTRRRNRVNGVVRAHTDHEILVDVVQSFGNCPQYITTRDLEFTQPPAEMEPAERVRFTALDQVTTDLIRQAETFFVASHNNVDDQRDTGGVDVNHRGGRPGFVKVDGNVLTIPDFKGNFAFNTLGNFLVNPKGGLLFVDFETGDLVQLTGTVEVLWDPTEEVRAFEGAERAWRFHLDHGQRLVSAAPVRWNRLEMSPNTERTGDWAQAGDGAALTEA